MTYNNIKGHRKPGFHPLFRRYIFRETTGERGKLISPAALGLSRQKKLDTNAKAIQQTDFVGELKKLGDDGNAADKSNDQSMFVLTNLDKIKETRLKFSRGSVTVL